MFKKNIPAAIKDRLHYTPSTGVFTWKTANKYNLWLLNARAGCVKGCYESIKINGIAYQSHRVAWFYMTGDQPDVIDHINGNSLDNRFINIRNVTQLENAQNHKEKIKGNGLPTGVTRSGNKFTAIITVNKKVIHLGRFRTKLKAKEAYREARDSLHDSPVMDK